MLTISLLAATFVASTLVTFEMIRVVDDKKQNE